MFLKTSITILLEVAKLYNIKGREMPPKEVEHLEKVNKKIHYTIGVQKEINGIISNLKGSLMEIS
ncbi:hypothetical protein [Borreliella kurtenbachii]